MSAEHIARLEREVRLLRTLVHSSPTAKLAEQLIAEAEARCAKRLRRARKKLLLASHEDKVGRMTKKELSSYFNQVVREIMNY